MEDANTPKQVEHKRNFDYTMMDDYQTCPRKYYYRHVKGMVGKKPQYAPAFGSAIHHALDAWYIMRHSGVVDLSIITDDFKRNFVENKEEDDKRTHACGEWIIKNYDEKYRDQRWKLVHSEMTFKIPLDNGNQFMGRIDKIIEWDNVLWIVDHKTTSQLGASYFKMVQPSLQFPGYVWAARKMGFNVVGVIVDAVLVAKGLLDSSRRASLTPLARYDAYVADWQLEEWYKTAVAIQLDIEHSERLDKWTPRFGSCTHFGECAYRKVDIEEPSLRQRILDAEYKQEFWSPLNESTSE